jgi:hypothetical protein
MYSNSTKFFFLSFQKVLIQINPIPNYPQFVQYHKYFLLEFNLSKFYLLYTLKIFNHKFNCNEHHKLTNCVNSQYFISKSLHEIGFYLNSHKFSRLKCSRNFYL